jgi:hypothetical protein
VEHRGSAERLARAVYPDYLIHQEHPVRLERQAREVLPEHPVRAARAAEQTEPAAHREAPGRPVPPERLAQPALPVRVAAHQVLPAALERAEIPGLRELQVRAERARVLQVSAGHLVLQEPMEAWERLERAEHRG